MTVAAASTAMLLLQTVAKETEPPVTSTAPSSETAAMPLSSVANPLYPMVAPATTVPSGSPAHSLFT